MGTPEKPVQVKVFVDKKKKKVIFAEAAEDFVDLLFSFFTFPLGTIAKLSRKHADSKDVKVGSLTSLYESVVSLNEKHFSCYKDWLVNPRNSSASVCQKLKINPDDMKPIASNVAGCQDYYPVIVRSMANFIITDDLTVLPVMFDTSIKLLKSHGIENINLLEERTMYFGVEEFLNLLKWSLLTNNTLTNLVFEGAS
ncbi:uncharacterized protein LOC111903057 [Lactuca sativa]|uniref:uncharacterized protein LOC111903057 n=1 Tax=Lactuca sativa TaxID=4236 RepID=UPI001C68BBC1|nr:uncharacterized protein LOC111903057 [Lactuca sativa]